MGLLDDYSQFNATSSDDDKSNPLDLRRKRAELERQIVMVDSDLKKILREKQDFEMAGRRLKKQEERIRVERDVLGKKLKKMEDDQRVLEDEIKKLKKELKILV